MHNALLSRACHSLWLVETIDFDFPVPHIVHLLRWRDVLSCAADRDKRTC